MVEFTSEWILITYLSILTKILSCNKKLVLFCMQNAFYLLIVTILLNVLCGPFAGA